LTFPTLLVPENQESPQTEAETESFSGSLDSNTLGEEPSAPSPSP
jgi:hypothetical protein